MRRRKSFIFLLMIMMAIYFLEAYNVNLSFQEKKILSFANENHQYLVKIIEVKSDEEKVSFKAKPISVDGKKVYINAYILLNYYGQTDNIADLTRSMISFRASLNVPNSQRNPKCFDYKKYLKSRRIFLTYTLKNYSVEEYERNIVEKYERWLFIQKNKFLNNLSNNSQGIVAGILFGDTSHLDDTIYDQFRTNGTAHILAVSGLHIGILYSIYCKLFKNRNSVFSLAILGMVLFSYGTLSMWSPSTIRATLMIAMNIVAKEFDLRYDLLTAMSIVGLILILSNPYVVLGTSFQMSFLAIASLVFIGPIIPKKIPESMRNTMAVNIGLLGFQMYTFNYVSLTALVANIPIVLLASYLVPIAIIGFILFAVMGNTGIIFKIIELLTALLEKVNALSTINGKGSIQVASPRLFFVLLLSLLLFFICSEYYEIIKSRGESKAKIRIISIIVAISAIFSMIYYNPISDDDIVFIDVGQGDSTHISAGKIDVLIDGGGNINYNVGKNTLKPYLLHNGISNIDKVLLTHMHTDHYQGIVELNECYRIKDITIGSKKGDVIKLADDIYITAIWPTVYNPNDKMKDENRNCSVFIVNYKGYKIMITGDLDEMGERDIIKKYDKETLRCDILKVGHHGSKYSSSDAFLEAVNPSYAVIQVGKNNYGHPSNETLERLYKRGIKVFRNDINGAIGFRFKTSGIVCHTMLN